MATFIVGFAGGSGSGKSTVIQEVQDGIRRAGGEKTVCLSADSYYRDLSLVSSEEREKHDFDHPDAIEWDLFQQHLTQLRDGQTVDIPVYNFVTHTRQKETITVQPAPVILVDGILIYWPPELRKIFNLRIFVDVPPDECLARRILRDMEERGRGVRSVIDQWRATVRPGYDNFVLPTKQFANLIVPHGGGNNEAVEAIVQRILAHTRQK